MAVRSLSEDDGLNSDARSVSVVILLTIVDSVIRQLDCANV